MSDTDVERALYAFRVWLAERGIPADDLDEREVVRWIAPRIVDAVIALGRCTLPVASWDKRFIRSMRERQSDAVTLKQAAMVCKLRHKYRRQAGPSPLPIWWTEEIPA